MNRLSKYPVRTKGDDDVDWKNISEEEWEMNFRPLRQLPTESACYCRLLSVATGFAAFSMLVIAVLNAMCPFLFGNPETLLLILLAAAIPCLRELWKPNNETGIMLFCMLVLLLVISNLGLMFANGYRNEFFLSVFIAVVLPLVLFFIDRVGCMHVHWLTASPMMDKSTMVLLRETWRQRFGRGLFVPAKACSKKRVGSAMQIDSCFRLISFYPAFLASVFFICFGSVIGAQFTSASLITQASIISTSLMIVLAAIWTDYRYEGSVAAAVSAMRLFCTALTFRKHPGTIQYPMKYRWRLNLFFSVITALSFAVTSLWFPWTTESFIHVDSVTQLLLNITIQSLVVFVLPPLLMFAMAVIAIGPVLRQFELLCESEHALLANKGWTEFDGYNDRLVNSGNVSEAECVWVGFHKERQFPILIPVALLNQHAHLLGGSGSGKTGLGLSTLVAQLIKRNEGPVIVIDGKGDEAFFQAIRNWCEEEQRKFKWFTTSAEKSSYLFNPLGQAAIEKFSLSEIVGFMLLSLNLFHGSDYGRGWFTQASKTALAEAAKLKAEGISRPTNFKLFCKHLEQVMREDKRLEKPAMHVLFMLQMLSEFPQMNDSGNTDGTAHSAVKHAIEMYEVIEKKQCVYFGFDSLTDVSTAGELSRMAVYSIISAAKAYEQEKKKKPKVTVVIDEAQNVFASNIGTAIEMARSFGVSFVFAHQTRDQLKLDGSTDLRSVVDSCTQVKLHFDAQGETVRHLQDISGEVGYADTTWDQFVSDVHAEKLSMTHAVGWDDQPATAKVKMNVGPRLTLNDIQDSASEPNGCIFAINRKLGLAQYNGAFPIHIDYPIGINEFGENQKLRWPPTDMETTSALPHWPKLTDETVVRNLLPERASKDVERDLNDIASDLFGED